MSEFNSTGLVISRFDEILEEIQEVQESSIQDKFKYSDNKLIHQINSSYALITHRVLELIEASFDATKIQKAEGIHLEEIGLLRGIYRIGAVPSSTSSQYAWLFNGATIPAGSEFSSSALEGTVTNPTSVLADPSNCSSVSLKVVRGAGTAADSTSYTVTINDNDYTYITGLSEGVSGVQSGIAALFTADSSKTFSYTLEGDDSFIITADTGTSLSVRISSTFLNIEKVRVYFYTESTSTGQEEFPAYTIDTLDTSVVGFIETNNDQAYSIGADVESDEAFRLRIQEGNSGDSTGTLISIKSALETNVDSVSLVEVIENTNESPTDSEGRPLHSYECLVIGGSDEDIASEVWRTKPVGVRTYGTTLVNHIDSSGVSREVYFSRPTEVPLAARITYFPYTEESLAADTEQTMADLVSDYVNDLSIGVDAIPGRSFGPIYENTSGVGRLIIEFQEIPVSGSIPVTSEWSQETLPIASTAFASIQDTDITVIQGV